MLNNNNIVRVIMAFFCSLNRALPGSPFKQNTVQSNTYFHACQRTSFSKISFRPVLGQHNSPVRIFEGSLVLLHSVKTVRAVAKKSVTENNVIQHFPWLLVPFRNQGTKNCISRFVFEFQQPGFPQPVSLPEISRVKFNCFREQLNSNLVMP